MQGNQQPNSAFAEFPKLPDFVDSTMAGAFGACPQKFFYEFILNRSRGPSVHLNAGIAMASALEAFRTAFFIKKQRYEEAILEAFRAFLKNWNRGKAEEVEFIEELEPEGTTKTFARMWGAFKYYLEVFPIETEQFLPITEGEQTGVEFSFAIPTEVPHPETGDPILYSGRCDMIARVRGGNTIYVLDDKTTAYSTKDTSKWNMRGQLLGYVYAARQFGYDVQGAVIREIAIQKTQYQHGQHILLYPPYLVEDWWRELNRRVRAAVALYQLSQEMWEKDPESFWKAYPRSYGDACSSYGGCGFMQLCRAENPLHWIDQYEEVVWDPLN